MIVLDGKGGSGGILGSKCCHTRPMPQKMGVALPMAMMRSLVKVTSPDGGPRRMVEFQCGISRCQRSCCFIYIQIKEGNHDFRRDEEG